MAGSKFEMLVPAERVILRLIDGPELWNDELVD